jgi:hypothetical protein
MGVAMTGWLAGKTARLMGAHPVIEQALVAAGARMVTDGDCDVCIHVAAPPPVVPAHEQAHEAWRKRKHELALQIAALHADPRIAKALSIRYLPENIHKIA